MSLPESTPGQAKWVCLILAAALGIAGLLPIVSIGQALLSGRAPIHHKILPTETVLRSEEPARFQSAIKSLSMPAVFFLSLAMVNLYFYRRLRD